MAIRKVTIRATTSVQRVGSGIRVKTSVSNGRTTKTSSKTIHPR